MHEEEQTPEEREEIARLRKKYRHIVAWGRFMGSYSYYVEAELLRAEKDNAPKDAMYKKDHVWVTYEQSTNMASGTRTRMEELLNEA
jgi:hypothetical protein